MVNNLHPITLREEKTMTWTSGRLPSCVSCDKIETPVRVNDAFDRNSRTKAIQKPARTIWASSPGSDQEEAATTKLIAELH